MDEKKEITNKEIKLFEYLITYINNEEGCEDIEIVESENAKKAKEDFFQTFGNHVIKYIEKIN